MSNEIQFETDYAAALLTLSDWGAARLGIERLIVHPTQNKSLF